MSDLQVAETIIEQMGGYGRLKALVGAHGFVGGDKSVMFMFKGSYKVNKCRVILDRGRDLYRMELIKVNRWTGDHEIVYEEDGLFFDMLKPTFEEQTGLYLSLS